MMKILKCIYQKNDDKAILIDNKLKYQNVEPEFEWDFKSEVSTLIESDYIHKDDIKGKIYTTEKPLRPGLRGVTLFANGRMINVAEFFGRSDSSHFFSYTIGWLDVDFIDNVEYDLIATDRQSISWEHELTSPLRIFLSNCLRALEAEWREKRKAKRREKVKEKTKVDINKWLKTIPQEIVEKLEAIVKNVDGSELTAEEQSETIENLHSLIPEYPYYHWRHLHTKIQDASRVDYHKQDYYRAFIEAAKRYISETRTKSGSTNRTDSGMMGEVYGRGKMLSVSSKYKKPDGTVFNQDTLENIEDGQKYLSMGMVAGGRNPVSHEEIKDLRDSGLFTEKDCLDALSVLSHLMRRLEDS